MIKHCDVCGKPLQMVQKFKTQEIVVGIMCDCQIEEQRKKDERIRKYEEEQKLRRRMNRAYGSRIPEGTFDKDDGRQPKAMNDIKKYLANFKDHKVSGRGLLLLGSTGQGKTFAAECIANELFNAGANVIMRSAIQIVMEVQNSGFNMADYVENMSRADLLILDDLGTERDTDFAHETIFAVVDARYYSHKPIVITTNLSVEEMMNPSSLYNQRLYGRILERCMPVEFAEKRSRI